MRLSINELSNLTGFDRRRVTKKLEDLPHEDGPKKAKLYDTVLAMRMLYAGIGEGLDPQQEKAALDKVRREIGELERDKKRGDLVASSEVEAEWLSLIGAVRSGMLAVPSRIAPEIIGLSDERKIEDVITAGIHEAMQSIADNG